MRAPNPIADIRWTTKLHWTTLKHLCGSQQTVENCERDGNTRPPHLPPEKPVCRKKQQLEPDMEQQPGSKLGKLSTGHRTGKSQFSFQSQRKTMPKNVQTTAQLHSFYAIKVMLKIIQAMLQQYVNWELSDVQAGFRKARGTRD